MYYYLEMITNYFWWTKFKISSLVSKGPAEQLLVNRGGNLSIDEMTQHVFPLMKNYQVKDEKFQKLLSNLQTGKVTKSDAKNPMNLYFFNHTKDK